MLTREDFLSLNFVKKEDFTGSHKGMRFMLHQETVEEEKKLKVYIWSEPFCFDTTPDEQKEITDYLDEKCAEIDTLVEKKQQFLAKMANYKKSLIYEYVTGKKEVA